MKANPFASLEDRDAEDVDAILVESSVVKTEMTNETAGRKRRRRQKKSKRAKLFQRFISPMKQIWQFFGFIIANVLSLFLKEFRNASAVPEKDELVQTINSLKVRLQQLEQKTAVESSGKPVAQVLPGIINNPAPLLDAEALAETEKYRKMLGVGVPRPAVRQKMIKDGVDPTLLFPDEPLVVKSSVHVVTKKVGSNKIQTPAARGFSVSVAALEEIRGSLRKPGQTPSVMQTPKPQQFSVTVSALEEIKGSLRKQTSKVVLDENCAMRPSCTRNALSEARNGLRQSKVTPESGKKKTPRSGLRDLTNSTATSAKTPFTKKQLRSPSTARSDGEFLHLALLKKFQNIDSPSDRG